MAERAVDFIVCQRVSQTYAPPAGQASRSPHTSTHETPQDRGRGKADATR